MLRNAVAGTGNQAAGAAGLSSVECWNAYGRNYWRGPRTQAKAAPAELRCIGFLILLKRI